MTPKKYDTTFFSVQFQKYFLKKILHTTFFPRFFRGGGKGRFWNPIEFEASIGSSAFFACRCGGRGLTSINRKKNGEKEKMDNGNDISLCSGVNSG